MAILKVSINGASFSAEGTEEDVKNSYQMFLKAVTDDHLAQLIKVLDKNKVDFTNRINEIHQEATQQVEELFKKLLETNKT